MKRIALFLAALVSLATPSLAHPGHLAAQGALHGFMHPLSGVDHLMVMVAVGLFAIQLGGRALYAVPATFMVVMALGGALAVSGVALPFVEIAIALSVLVMGAAVAFGARMNTALAMALVGTFALFHGHAHGSEMPLDASGLAYGLGFMSATAMLHVAGIALAYLLPIRKGLRLAQS